LTNPPPGLIPLTFGGVFFGSYLGLFFCYFLSPIGPPSRACKRAVALLTKLLLLFPPALVSSLHVRTPRFLGPRSKTPFPFPSLFHVPFFFWSEKAATTHEPVGMWGKMIVLRALYFPRGSFLMSWPSFSNFPFRTLSSFPLPFFFSRRDPIVGLPPRLWLGLGFDLSSSFFLFILLAFFSFSPNTLEVQ